MTTVLYLATDLYSTGGIQRYSNTQIKALQEILGESSVRIYVLHPRPENPLFELPFEISYTGKPGKISNRMSYVNLTIKYCIQYKPNIIWVNLTKLFPLAFICSELYKNVHTIGNVYGLEVWSKLSIFEKYATRRLSHIISDCHFTANYIEENLGVIDSRISVIWDPVDSNRFTPRQSASRILPQYGIPYHPETKYLMTLGRVSKISRYKGYDRMLDIMRIMDREDIKYLIAGDGNDRDRLERRVMEEGLSGRVFFLGSIPENDLVDVYNAADIFVLVSDRGYGRGEGVPLTPLEAAACGKPIIVGDEDGSTDSVEHGKNGFIVSPRDYDSIIAAILSLVDNPNLRRRMGIEARNRIEELFSYEVFKKRTESFIEQVLK